MEKWPCYYGRQNAKPLWQLGIRGRGYGYHRAQAGRTGSGAAANGSGTRCGLTMPGELTASIAHELGQPLAAILSNAESAGLQAPFLPSFLQSL
jgi:signal transduction histidine kinase